MRVMRIEQIVASGVVLAVVVTAALMLPVPVVAQQGASDEVTFTRDIAPILQRSCQRCHHTDGVAPMPLIEYEQVRPYARMIMLRTGIRDQAGTMPPWYIEKDIGIQHYKDDPSLSDEELAAIVAWVRAGAPEGDPEDMPPPLVWDDRAGWSAGEPDLIVVLPESTVASDAPDWWGDIESVPTELTEDRYVKSVEIREINDVPSRNSEGRKTVGGRYVVHHMIWSTRVLEVAEGEDASPASGRNRSTGWPVHEVGRNPDIFDPDGGRLLRAGSSVVSNSVHLHSNGRDTKAHLEIGFRFHPVG